MEIQTEFYHVLPTPMCVLWMSKVLLMNCAITNVVEIKSMYNIKCSDCMQLRSSDAVDGRLIQLLA